MLLRFGVSILLRNRRGESFKTHGSNFRLGEKDACGGGGGGGGGSCWCRHCCCCKRRWVAWWRMKSFFFGHCWKLKGNLLCF